MEIKKRTELPGSVEKPGAYRQSPPPPLYTRGAGAQKTGHSTGNCERKGHGQQTQSQTRSFRNPAAKEHDQRGAAFVVRVPPGIPYPVLPTKGSGEIYCGFLLPESRLGG